MGAAAVPYHALAARVQHLQQHGEPAVAAAAAAAAGRRALGAVATKRSVQAVLSVAAADTLSPDLSW